MSETLRSVEILADLVGFPTVSRDPNRGLLLYIEDYLRGHGVSSDILWTPDGRKGNLWATIGPADRRGIILSGHSDVVPVDGQDWTGDPFTLRTGTADDGTGVTERLYGRGTCDMKGFIAIALAFVPEMVRRPLKVPVHLAISYDEELGCLGVRSLVERIAAMPVKPAMCLVGEPTNLQVITGHKGGRSYRAHFTGLSAHSSLAPTAPNTIESAAELVLFLRGIAREWQTNGPFDSEYDIVHSTLSTGMISGGTAINIVPANCTVTFEFRHLASLDADALMRRIEAFATDKLLPEMQALAPKASIRFEALYEYPGLDMAPEHPAVTFMKQLVGRNDHAKVAYGTEAGLFQSRAGVASVVCGPGSIAQAHKPDEYIERSEIAAGEQMIARLLDRLSTDGPLVPPFEARGGA